MYIVILLLLFILPIAIFALAMVGTYRGKYTENLTIYEMRKCEETIRRNLRGNLEKYRKDVQGKEGASCLDVSDLAEALELQIVKDDKIQDELRGKLDEPSDKKYNGTIKHRGNNEDKYAVNFDIMHEIMHYIFDVGEGKKVEQSFARLHHGYQRGHHEQIIDYYAAAAAIPRDELVSLLQNDNRKSDDSMLISELMETYKQPEATIIRRIKEVSMLQ